MAGSKIIYKLTKKNTLGMFIFYTLLFSIIIYTVIHFSPLILAELEIQRLKTRYNDKIDSLNLEGKEISDISTEYYHGLGKIIRFSHYFEDVDINGLIDAKDIQGNLLTVKILLKRVEEYKEKRIFFYYGWDWTIGILIPLLFPMVQAVFKGIRIHKEANGRK